jgi:putative transcriptional regulator
MTAAYFGAVSAVSQKYKLIRCEKRLSRRLADIVGVSRNTVCSMETGQFNPTLKLALVLCVALVQI